jgi:formylglycine-generating enzyme required for sulfatase activity
MAWTGWRKRLLAGTLAGAGWAGVGEAEGLAIQSFNGTGQLVFNELSTATVYRVEWANAPTGVWHTGSPGVTGIVARGTGQNAATVGVSAASCFYRVVASVTNATPPVTEGDYLVVDLSGGPSASSYPVSYLSAVPGGGWTDEHKTTKLVLRKIPATAPNFMMGSPANELGRNSGETQHAVTLTKGFYLGVFEVTQRQWELVTGNKPSYFNNASYYAARPVEQVSYYDIRENPANSAISPNWPATNAVHARSFMGRLRAKTGLSAFDLPTESQWEYACRVGTSTALNSGYNLTNMSSDARMAEVGRYYYNNGSGYTQGGDTSVGTAKVGSYLPNAWGLYDMHGNVWEWCLDWYGTYPGTVSDPKGAASGTYRVNRGGCWGDLAYVCRSAIRHIRYPDYRNFSDGFRACCAPPGQQ